LGGITGRDFDSDPGQIAIWYDVNPDIPKPEGFSIRTKDGKWDLDICTFVGFPVVFMQELGNVKQAREDYGVVDIQIVKGPGSLV